MSDRSQGPQPNQPHGRAMKTGRPVGPATPRMSNVEDRAPGPSQPRNPAYAPAPAPRPPAAPGRAPEQPRRVFVSKGAFSGHGGRVQDAQRVALRKAASGVPRVFPEPSSTIPPHVREWLPHKSPAVRPFVADLDEMFEAELRRKRNTDDLDVGRFGSRNIAPACGRGSPLKWNTPARKNVLVSRLDDDDRPRAARMIATNPRMVHDHQAPSDDEEVQGPFSVNAPRLRQIATKSGVSIKGARKLDVISISDESSSESSSGSDTETETGPNPIPELLAAAEACISPIFRFKQLKQLPFLMRNLRHGFIHTHKCLDSDVKMDRVKPDNPVIVKYRLDDDPFPSLDSNIETWSGTLQDWDCPLCPLNGVFLNRDMLDYHLRRDHSEVKSSWTEIITNDGIERTLQLSLPNVDELVSDSSEDESEEEEQIELQLDPDTVMVPAGDEPLLASTSKFLGTSAPIAQRSRDVVVIDLTEDEPSEPPRLPSPNPIVKKWRDDSPAPSSQTLMSVRERSTTTGTTTTTTTTTTLTTTTSATMSTSTSTSARSSTMSTSQSARGSLPLRYPTPPPQTDPLGPAAQPPYSLETPGPDGREAQYSCRPGGPRLVDLLSTLSLEPFGVLAWQVVATEEELFEMDEIQDPDKVIWALWNRWIMLNHRLFVTKPYPRGILAFVNDNWQMIHKAAGWGALRAFLLTFLATRYLDMKEVLSILNHYEANTGMDQWYKDPELEE